MAQQQPRASVAGAVNTPAPVVVSEAPPAAAKGPPPQLTIEDTPATARTEEPPQLTIEDIPATAAATQRRQRTAEEQQELDDLFKKIKNLGGNIGDKVKDGTVGAVNKIKEELEDVKRELDDARGVINKVGDFFKNFPNMIKNEFEKIINKIKDLVDVALKPFKAAAAWLQKIPEIWNKFKGWIISVCCTVVLVCSAAILGPFIMPLLSGLSALRSAGNTYAAAVQ